MIDFGRVITVNSSIADAARQGARQAAATATPEDAPWSTPVGLCSGKVFTKDVNTAANPTSGCLTDAQILNAVKSALALTPVATVTKQPSGATPTNCGGAAPPPGQTYVCINPAESTRKTEWDSGSNLGSFQIEVTVRSTILPWTPFTGLVSGITLASTSSTIAEY
jgi:hypothetical protein